MCCRSKVAEMEIRRELHDTFSWLFDRTRFRNEPYYYIVTDKPYQLEMEIGAIWNSKQVINESRKYMIKCKLVRLQPNHIFLFVSCVDLCFFTRAPVLKLPFGDEKMKRVTWNVRMFNMKRRTEKKRNGNNNNAANARKKAKRIWFLYYSPDSSSFASKFYCVKKPNVATVIVKIAVSLSTKYMHKFICCVSSTIV